MDAIHAVTGQQMLLYPSQRADKVRCKYAAVYGVQPDMVLVGNGSDDILAIAMRSFLGEGDTMVITDPTYSLYDVLADVQGPVFRPVAQRMANSDPDDLVSELADLWLQRWEADELRGGGGQEPAAGW